VKRKSLGEKYGLRRWLRLLMSDEHCLPASIPSELIAIYLNDPDAAPLYGCSRCGLALPVRCSNEWEAGREIEEVYFEYCPCCRH
jgi:hypothetical protein